jgi:hypothetical protein
VRELVALGRYPHGGRSRNYGRFTGRRAHWNEALRRSVPPVQFAERW